jgi:hypothetical protein
MHVYCQGQQDQVGKDSNILSFLKESKVADNLFFLLFLEVLITNQQTLINKRKSDFLLKLRKRIPSSYICISNGKKKISMHISDVNLSNEVT